MIFFTLLILLICSSCTLFVFTTCFSSTCSTFSHTLFSCYFCSFFRVCSCLSCFCNLFCHFPFLLLESLALSLYILLMDLLFFSFPFQQLLLHILTMT